MNDITRTDPSGAPRGRSASITPSTAPAGGLDPSESLATTLTSSYPSTNPSTGTRTGTVSTPDAGTVTRPGNTNPPRGVTAKSISNATPGAGVSTSVSITSAPSRTCDGTNPAAVVGPVTAVRVCPAFSRPRLAVRGPTQLIASNPAPVPVSCNVSVAGSAPL